MTRTASRPDPLAALVDREMALSDSDRALAIRLHDLVRDRVRFGFTTWFDAADDRRTWSLGVGHCNPQARLLVGLLQRGGLDACFRPVTIDNRVLYGLGPIPNRLSHVFSEVRLGSDWLRLDSYIADPLLREAGVHRLVKEGRMYGYGVHREAAASWDGRSDCFSQIADPAIILETFEPVDDLVDFYQSADYRHRVAGVHFDTLFGVGRPLQRVLDPWINARIEAMRSAERRRRPGRTGLVPIQKSQGDDAGL